MQLSHYAVHSNIQATKRSLEKYEKKDKGRIHMNAYFAALTEDLDDSVGILLNKLQELVSQIIPMLFTVRIMVQSQHYHQEENTSTVTTTL